jgi:hypothetical protein
MSLLNDASTGLTLISCVMPILNTSLISSGDPRSCSVPDGIGIFSASWAQSGRNVAPLGDGDGRERVKPSSSFLPSSRSVKKLSPFIRRGLRWLRLLDSTTSTLEALWMESSSIVSATQRAGSLEGQNVLSQDPTGNATSKQR